MKMSAFYRLTISYVGEEVDNCKIFEFFANSEQESNFEFLPGQFCSFRIPDGNNSTRCYSIASSTLLDGKFSIVVKRIPGGIVSNYLHENIRVGDSLDVSAPSGRFVVPDGCSNVALFAAGSGISPVISIAESTLKTTNGSVRLLYAGRAANLVTLKDRMSELERSYPDRLEVTYHFTSDKGHLRESDVADWLTKDGGAQAQPQHFICGPTAFMDICEGGALMAGADSSSIHIERFGTNAPRPIPKYDQIDSGALPAKLLVTLGGVVTEIDCPSDVSILEACRQAGLNPESSCESGFCGVCKAVKTDGEVEHLNNNCLSDSELGQGWILTCQAHLTPGTTTAISFDSGRSADQSEIGGKLPSKSFMAGWGLSRQRAALAGVSLMMAMIFCGWIAFSSVHANMLNPGPMAPGHQGLTCVSCHESAPGTTSQQLQSALKRLIFWRNDESEFVKFGFLKPESSDCVACHDRSKDSHPISRFREPRFMTAIETVDARECAGCHKEHTGVRVSAKMEFCSACHSTMAMKNDPLGDFPKTQEVASIETPKPVVKTRSIKPVAKTRSFQILPPPSAAIIEDAKPAMSHAILASTNRWDTCMGCHDFHGNHQRTTPTSMSMRIDTRLLQAYLIDGMDPYSKDKIVKDKETRP